MKLAVLFTLSLLIVLPGFSDNRATPQAIDKPSLLQDLRHFLDKGGDLFDGKSEKVRCYTGISFFGLNRIEYEVFPDLGFFRVRRFGTPNTERWVVLSKSIPKTNGPQQRLSQELKTSILLVGSGLVEDDITNSKISFAEKKKYKRISFPVQGEGFENREERECSLLAGKGDLIEEYYVYDLGRWVPIFDE